MEKNIKTGSSNVIFSDYPDLDIIRVENTYYMVSTTMHFMPGCVILRSYNLLDWEIASYVYDELDNTPGQKLEDGKGVYGCGMWAASIRYHEGLFYVCFVANDTHKTYLYTSEKIEGPWKKSTISGFYHDMSLLFDDDGRAFIVSGNSQIRLIELEKDLSGPKKGGINKIIVQEKDSVNLGYEGSHFYKINGKYYIFFIHWPKGKLRTEACYVSDSVDGPYSGGDVLNADYKHWNSGVAQGGIVDTPEGKWYGMLFQDHGAMGRMPVLVPVSFEKDFPVFGVNNTVPEELSVQDLKPGYKYEPLYCSDFADESGKLKGPWQWNHTPDYAFVKLSKNQLEITSCNIAKNPCLTKNSLTQRAFTEHCQGSVELNAASLKDGDTAGLCALEGDYGFIGIQNRDGKYFLVQGERQSKVEPYKIGSVDTMEPKIVMEKELKSPSAALKIRFVLEKAGQYAYFFYKEEDTADFIPFGRKKLSYTLDQFAGVRFDLFNWAAKETGGKVTFTNFKYELD